MTIVVVALIASMFKTAAFALELRGTEGVWCQSGYLGVRDSRFRFRVHSISLRARRFWVLGLRALDEQLDTFEPEVTLLVPEAWVRFFGIRLRFRVQGLGLYFTIATLPSNFRGGVLNTSKTGGFNGYSSHRTYEGAARVLCLMCVFLPKDFYEVYCNTYPQTLKPSSTKILNHQTQPQIQNPETLSPRIHEPEASTL